MLYLETDISKLYCGDCIEQIEKNDLHFDKVITSPPYNTQRDRYDRGYDVYKDNVKTNDEYIKFIISLFKEFETHLNENGCIIWNMSYGGENPNCMNLCIAEIIKQTDFTIADIIIWKKRSATPNNVSQNKMTRICEFIYIFCRSSEYQTFTSNKKIVSYRKTGQALYENVFNYFECANNDKPCELNHATFSSEFVEEIIKRYVKNDDVVLDCFSGTGTTLKVCEEKGIKFLGIELSQNQCEYSKNRIKSIQRQLI